MRGTIIFTSLALVLAVCSAVFPVNGEVAIYDDVIRLHVIAASDSESDQALKLKVRDKVLECVDGFLSAEAGCEAAKEILQSNTGIIRECAEKCIKDEGNDYSVNVLLGREEYPERSYEGVTLPAGEYYSVRVVIGEGKGKNWWCVLFPPLCVGAASEKSDKTMLQAGLTKDEVDIITENDGEGYVLKFRILEFFKEVFSREKTSKRR